MLVAPTLGQPRGLDPADLHRLRSVRDVRISPDGARVAVTAENREGPGRPAQEAFVVGTAGGEPVRLLADRGSVSTLRWSPDGRWLACFTGETDGPGLTVVRPDASGARRLAAIRETNHPLPSVADALAWSPDGRRIAFLSATPGPEPEPRTDPVVVTRYLYKPTASEGLARFNDNRRLHVFVVDVATRAVRQLTSGAAYEHSLAWSPGGEEIAFVSNREADADRVFNNDLFAVRVADGRVRRITSTKSAEYAPAWSPDGKRIAYLGTKRPLTSSETTMEDTHVWTVGADGADPREIGAVLDNRQGEPAWSVDGRFVYFTAQERGSVRLRRLPASGGPPEAVAPGESEAGVVHAWSLARNGAVALALATPSAPAALVVQTPSDHRTVATWNGEQLASREVAPVEALTFQSFDGLSVEAFLTKPLGVAGGSRHPLIVLLHGGPHAQQGPAFHEKAQVYAARGWAVLMVNYRGSTGYGQKLADAIFADQDGGEAKDVLAGIDAALARYAWLDSGRIGLEGTSYGGQLVNWLVTQTDRFRAAVATAGISNLVSFNYMAYYHDYLAVEFGHYPHEGALLDELWRRSPLRYVAKVRTPTLLLHGENDNDVPIAEAEQFYVALKDVGVETEMVRYPREGHGLSETAHIVDGLRRSIKWYEAHFARDGVKGGTETQNHGDER